MTDDTEETAVTTVDDKLPPLCDECGVNRADPPSNVCPGCEAYREHTGGY